jgi:hypothetical protein
MPDLIDQTAPGPTTLNLVLFQYSDFQQSFLLQRAGLPVDLTGYTATWTAESLGGLLFDWSSGVELSDSTTPGRIDLLIPGAQTAGLDTPDPPVKHDLRLTDPSGGIALVIQGSVAVVGGVATT